MTNYLLVSHTQSKDLIYGFKGKLTAQVIPVDISVSGYWDNTSTAKLHPMTWSQSELPPIEFTSNFTEPSFQYISYGVYQANPKMFYGNVRDIPSIPLGTINIIRNQIHNVYTTRDEWINQVHYTQTYISSQYLEQIDNTTYQIFLTGIAFNLPLFNNPIYNITTGAIITNAPTGNFNSNVGGLYGGLIKQNHFWQVFNQKTLVKKGDMPKIGTTEFYDTPYNPSKVKLDNCTIFIGGIYGPMQTAEIPIYEESKPIDVANIFATEYVYTYNPSLYINYNTFAIDYSSIVGSYGDVPKELTTIQFMPCVANIYQGIVSSYSNAYAIINTVPCSFSYPTINTSIDGTWTACSGQSVPICKKSNILYDPIPYKEVTFSSSIHLFDENNLEMKSIGNLDFKIYGSTLIAIDSKTFLMFGGVSYDNVLNTWDDWKNIKILKSVYKIVINDSMTNYTITKLRDTIYPHLFADCIYLSGNGINEQGLIAIAGGGEYFEIYDTINLRTSYYGKLSYGARYGGKTVLRIVDDNIELHIVGGYLRCMQDMPSNFVDTSGMKSIAWPDFDSKVQARLTYGGPILPGFNNNQAYVSYTDPILNIRSLFVIDGSGSGSDTSTTDRSWIPFPIPINMNYSVGDSQAVFYQLQFETPRIIQGIILSLSNDFGSTDLSTITEFSIYGSTDGLHWVLVKTFEFSIQQSSGLSDSVNFIDNNIQFSYIKIEVTKTSNNLSNIYISQIRVLTNNDVFIPLKSMYSTLYFNSVSNPKPPLFYFPHSIWDNPGVSNTLSTHLILNQGVEIVPLQKLTISPDISIDYNPKLNTTGIFNFTISDFIKNKNSIITVNNDTTTSKLLTSNSFTYDASGYGTSLGEFDLTIRNSSYLITKKLPAATIYFDIYVPPSYNFGDTVDLTIYFPSNAVAILTPGNISLINGDQSIQVLYSGDYYATISLDGQSLETNHITLNPTFVISLTPDNYDFTDPTIGVYLTSTFSLGNGIITPGNIAVNNNDSVIVYPTDTTIYTLSVNYNGQNYTSSVTIVKLDPLAINIISGTPITSSIVSTDPVSTFRSSQYKLFYFYGVTGDVFTISEIADTNWNTYLYLLDGTKTILAQDDDSAGNLNSIINSYTLPYTGLYYIECCSYANTLGNFTVSLNQQIIKPPMPM